MRNYKQIDTQELQKDKRFLKTKRILQVLAIFGMAVVIGINA
jgi:hypothetical protein